MLAAPVRTCQIMGSSSIWLQPERSGRSARSDNRGSARLVDEWLRARNALSIEIFFRTPSSVVHPVFCA